LPGEEPYILTKPLGRAILQLRTFPLMAFQKQFLRNMRHADAGTMAALIHNFMWAGVIYSTTQTVKGRGDKLTPESIAKGALNYSPTTGWLPMAIDPLAEIMGLEELKLNRYGPPGRATEGIIPLPPMIPTLNRVAHIPGSLLGLDGDRLDKNDIDAYAATPIIGSTYGFSAAFTALKNNAD